MGIKFLSYNFHRNFANFDKRKYLLNKLLNNYQYDILCAQEYIPAHHNKKVFEKLENEYKMLPQYMNPIFVNKDRFDFSDVCFAEHNKFVAAKVKDLSENKNFVVCNLHLNYGFYKKNESTRIRQLTEYIKMLDDFNDKELPVIISGDFNCVLGAVTLDLLSDYIDTYIPGKSRMESTWNDYNKEDSGDIIDHTFVKGFVVEDFKIIQDSYDNEIPSDHYPVYSVLRFDNAQ